jgi:uncharacterized protein
MKTSESETGSDFEVVRDPVWNTILLDPLARRIIDAAEFQRLRRVRQLGLAFLVYPGANHTRFDHALGVYNLARRALRLLDERDQLRALDPVDCRLVPYAALLHDIGHYPFSHAVEELDPSQVPGDHESLTGRFLATETIGEALGTIAPDAAARIEAMIRGRSESPLQGLVAGSLDLDKIEYLKRDARFCGVPYGEVDVDRLLHALAVLRDPETGRHEIGIHQKGISALESLLFAKYQMFRNVYWHHAVRAGTALFKRLVEEAIGGALIGPDDMVGQSDEGFLALLEARVAGARDGTAGARVAMLIRRLRERRLPKRAAEVPGELVRGLAFEEWFYADGGLRTAVERALGEELGLGAGDVFLDYPEKPRMMELDLLLRGRDGAVQRLTRGGRAGLIDLPRVSEELYYSARAFRVFTAERREIDVDRVIALLEVPAAALKARLSASEPLLQTAPA